MTESENEIRSFILTELRADAGTDGKPTVFGYASVFDQLSENLGWFKEKVARGAFSNTIKTDDIRALFNHDMNIVLGRNLAGTLRLWEDIHGLRFEIDLPDTQAARDLAASIKRGDVNQMSFAFRTIRDEWELIEDKSRQAELGTDLLRTLLEVRLYDVSVVTFPAYPQTSADVRDKAKAMVEERSRRAAEAGARADQIQAQERTKILRKQIELAESEA